MISKGFGACIGVLFLIVIVGGSNIERLRAGDSVEENVTPQSRDRRSPLRPNLPREERTQVAILGTPHLSTLGAKFSAGQLDRLVAAFASYRPEIVAVEEMPTELIAHMTNLESTYGDVIQQFAQNRVRLGKSMQGKLNLTWEQARDEMEEMLDELGKDNKSEQSVEDRIRLIKRMVASFDLASAALQWSYLSETERKAQVEFDSKLAKELDVALSAANEVSSIGIRLAHQLSLERIHMMDDFQVGPELMKIAPALMAEARGNAEYEGARSSPLYTESQSKLDAAVRGGDLLSYYQYLNSPSYVNADLATQWDVFFRMKLKSKLDRSRVALWEVRNLFMAAHIRMLSSRKPGVRILVIVGVGHKPFLEAYLGQLSDVDLVDTAALLGR